MGACDTGWFDCNSQEGDGCETDIFTDPENCGGCGSACTFPNGLGQCAGGSCFLVGCVSGYDDCNNDPSDGCETDLSNDVNNCGFCHNRCSSSVGTPVCNNGVCDVSSCNPGLADCDPNDGQPCETNIWADPNNCGGCGNACSLQNATALCANGTCVVDTCDAGWGDCDNQDPNGCETDTTSDPQNCGSCGNRCTYANATALCVSSNCQLGNCDPGYYNIDGDPLNGCECAEDSVPDQCNDSTIYDLGTMSDGASVQVTGNLIPAGDEDWYTFTAPDNNSQDINNGNDNYHLAISFAGNPANQYAFFVYRNTNMSAGCADIGNPVCANEDVAYDHYYYNRCVPSKPKSCRGSTTGPGDCGCVNNSARYWLRVVRAGSTVSCDPYQILIEFTQ